MLPLQAYRLRKTLRQLQDCDVDVIVYAGQSNAMGFGVGTSELSYQPREDILLYYRNKISVATERVINRRDHRAIFALTFAEKFAEEQQGSGHKILLIGTAVGGTSFSDHRWGLQDDLYRNACTMTQTVLQALPKARLRCLLWHQGETDATNLVTQEYYIDKLQTLIADFRKRFGEDLPVLAGDYVPAWKAVTPNAQNIADATKQVVDALPACAFVSSDGLTGNPEPDGIHFDRKSLREFGLRYWDAYTALRKDSQND